MWDGRAFGTEALYGAEDVGAVTMSVVGEGFDRASGGAATTAVAKKKPSHAPPEDNARPAGRNRDCRRVTVRLSDQDHARLMELAEGAALATYIRAKALGDDLPCRKRRSVASVADKQALAQILGLLGQSRIANNLNQLAYHANIGALEMDDEVRAQIHEGYEHVLFMRQALMRALGMRA